MPSAPQSQVSSSRDIHVVFSWSLFGNIRILRQVGQVIGDETSFKFDR